LIGNGGDLDSRHGALSVHGIRTHGRIVFPSNTINNTITVAPEDAIFQPRSAPRIHGIATATVNNFFELLADGGIVPIACKCVCWPVHKWKSSSQLPSSKPLEA
jgi:hypothetical protein